MAVLAERFDQYEPHCRTAPVVPGAPGAPEVPRPEAPRVLPLRQPRPVSRTRPPTRAAAVRAPRVIAAPRLPRPRPLPLGWLVLLGAVVCAAVYGLGALAGAGSAASVPDRVVTVVVTPGQSLWSIARQHAPSSDPAAVVDRIEQLNGLTEGAAVTPGTPLTVPDDLGPR